MSYLVLARKWRPQSFADMTGQEHVVTTLANALRSGRVAHAFLFTGPRGVGKTTAARILARALNCEQGVGPEPCGKCQTCQEIALGTHVDVIEIDGASNNSVEDVRALREGAKYVPARARTKVYIIDEVHQLSSAAFNALLKTLEEPPPHVKFIFATTEVQKIPETILSRCQRHNFRLVPLAKMIGRLVHILGAEKVKMDEGAVALVARQAQGSMRDALSLLDTVLGACGDTVDEAAAAETLGVIERSAVTALADALVARDARAVLESVERAYQAGFDLALLANDLAVELRNMLVATVPGAPLDLPEHERADLEKRARAVDPAQLARLADLVAGALEGIHKAQSPRLSLEVALLKAVHLPPGESVAALLARAEELARRLGEPPSGAARPGGAGARSPEAAMRGKIAAPAAPTAPLRAEADARLEPCARPEAPARLEPPARPAPRTIPRPEAPSALPGDPRAAWRALCDAVRARRATLAAFLSTAQPLAVEPTIVLGFPKGDFNGEQVLEARNRSLLEEVWGRPFEVQWLDETAAARGPASLAQQAAGEARTRREQESRALRETIVEAVRILDGEIVAVDAKE